LAFEAFKTGITIRIAKTIVMMMKAMNYDVYDDDGDDGEKC
jgi:hypothetical protein